MSCKYVQAEKYDGLIKSNRESLLVSKRKCKQSSNIYSDVEKIQNTSMNSLLAKPFKQEHQLLITTEDKVIKSAKITIPQGQFAMEKDIYISVFSDFKDRMSVIPSTS